MGKKLLSAHTFGNERGEFDNFYNDEIFIEKDSEIAVHSCCLEIDNLKIRIDENSDQLAYRIDNGSTDSSQRFINIPHGQYGKDNIDDLINYITDMFNSSLNVDVENACEWKIETVAVPNQKINKQLIFRLSDSKRYNAFDDSKSDGLNRDRFSFGSQINVINSTQDSQPVLVRNTPPQLPHDNMNQVCVGKIKICKGSCQTGVQLIKLPPVNSLANESGFVIGWGDARHDYVNHAVQKGHLRYFVRCPPMLGTTAFYHFKIKGEQEQLSAVQVLIGDKVQIELSEGVVRGVIYRLAGGVDRQILFEDRYPYNSQGVNTDQDIDLKPVLALFGRSTNMEVRNFYYNADPYTVNNSSIIRLNSLSYTVDEDPPLFGSGNISFILTFQNINMANQFGYELVSPQSTDGASQNHIASDDNECRAVNSFLRSHHGANFKIEMLNLMIDSYDSLTAGRKNIICVIPVEDEFIDNQKSRINFQPENILYLSIKNKDRLSLRNIKCRLLDSLNNPVGLIDFSSINFIINDC